MGFGVGRALTPFLKDENMTTLHAYKRTAQIVVDLPALKLKLKFAPDAEGNVVCAVPDGPAVDLLLNISEAYRVFGAAPEGSTGDDDENQDAGSRYILSHGEGDETLDLRTLTKAALLDFARENEIPGIDKDSKKEVVLEQIVDFFRVPA
jgi:hypothetical protein